MKTQKGYLIKWILLKIHKLGIRFRVHILPVHFYTPVPNIRELQKTLGVWAKKSELPGISVNLDEQATMLKAICIPYQKEFAHNKIYREATANFGEEYGYIEAQALHAVIRHYKPNHIIEVGSGVSTYCMLKACEMNEREKGEGCNIISIEPYPSKKLKEVFQIELISKPVQTIPVEIFNQLRENDLLSIDSTHTVKPGGDVNHLILEVLPRLRPGVIVHFHDIFLPYDYQRNILKTFFHWAETSLLHAFLIFNEKAKIIFCLSHLHYERQDVLREVFPEYNPQIDIDGLQPEKYKAFEEIPEHFPSSIYIQIV